MRCNGTLPPLTSQEAHVKPLPLANISAGPYLFFLHPSAHPDKSKKLCFLQIGLGVPELCLATVSLIFLKMLKISASIEAAASGIQRGVHLCTTAQKNQ